MSCSRDETGHRARVVSIHSFIGQIRGRKVLCMRNILEKLMANSNLGLVKYALINATRRQIMPEKIGDEGVSLFQRQWRCDLRKRTAQTLAVSATDHSIFLAVAEFFSIEFV